MIVELTLAEISKDVITSINTNFSEVEGGAVNTKCKLNGDSAHRDLV